jgi:hypothetical protein
VLDAQRHRERRELVASDSSLAGRAIDAVDALLREVHVKKTPASPPVSSLPVVPLAKSGREAGHHPECDAKGDVSELVALRLDA